MKERNDERALLDALNTNENMDGFRILDFNETGVYLSVHPPSGKGIPLDSDRLIEELVSMQISNIDHKLLNKAVQLQTGESIKIAPPQEEAKRDGVVRVEISKDKMEAWITIYPPLGGRAMEEADCQNALNEAGVSYGIKEKEMINALSSEQISKPTLVAKGLEPVHGINASIHYKSAYGDSKLLPKELEDGKVDFYNMDLINNVKAGEVLAVKTPATEGTSGMNVLGQVIQFKPGKDYLLVKGQNIELIDKGNTAVATINGQVILKEKAIHVLPVYEHMGDVDFSSGNLEFLGSIVVTGSVNNGFTVTAEGDVEISERVEGGNVFAGGSIQIRKGIQGRGKGLVQAKGDVVTKYIENASVSSEQNIYSEAIMHSKVIAGKSIIISGKKGIIVGGTCCAGEIIKTRFIGAELATRTILEVGVNPQLRQEYNNTKRLIKDNEQNYDKTIKAIKLLKKMEIEHKIMSDDKKTILIKAKKTQEKLEQFLENLIEKKIHLEKIIIELKHGKVEASERIYPGVIANIGRSVLNVKEKINGATLFEEAGEIKIIPFIPSK